MKAFIDVRLLQILALNETELSYASSFGRMQAEGSAVWIDVPPGEDIAECDLVAGSPPAFVLNSARKAARVANENGVRQLKQRIAGFDGSTVVDPSTKQFLLDVKRALVVLARGIQQE